MITLAHIKDEGYSKIKSIEINLSNNKKYRKLITDLLEVIKEKF